MRSFAVGQINHGSLSGINDEHTGNTYIVPPRTQECVVAPRNLFREYVDTLVIESERIVRVYVCIIE